MGRLQMSGYLLRGVSRMLLMAALALVLTAGMLAGAATAQQRRDGCAPIDGLEQVRRAHLRSLNAIRVRAGLRVLAVDARLDRVAQDFACLLARTGQFDHVGPDGSTLGDRVRAGGYGYCLIAENIARGQRSVDEVLLGWVKSPGHLANIRRPEVIEIGFGVAHAVVSGAEVGEPAGSLGELAESLDGRPRAAVAPMRALVWVQLFGRPC